MLDDDWGKLQAIFLEAMDLAATERGAFLDRACVGRGDLRTEAEALLKADTADTDPLLQAIEREAASLLDDSSLEGTRLGPYLLRRELGRGGMGSVYLAERDDEHFHKEVAIKVVKRGMDTTEVMERFRHERQILAGLEHPYIARLLDGGTVPDGRPYFVLECVTGLPIDEYCRTCGLDLHARLRLFLKVCEAVTYAHRSLVIHRDLKPGNIFVTRDGVPKLLDFGMAKLMDPNLDPGLTAYQGIGPLTPEYASPEQVQGLGITTAVDVYALGTILYELLTGARAQTIRTLTPMEIERVICRAEPPRASVSAASHGMPFQLDQDLETIIAMAMRKERERRYAGVDLLAEDLERYLAGLPVHARADTLGYRAGKFIRRHGMVLAATSLAAGGILVGAGLGLRSELRSAEQARFSREFGQHIAALEQFGKISALLPLHDIRQDRAQIRGRLVQIQKEMERAGPLGAGPGNYALGRGHLALGEEDAARTCLERAWAAGLRDPDTAASLGRALGRQYQQKLATLREISRPDLRELRQHELEAQYREPALIYLRKAAGARSDSPQILEALIALFEKRMDAALALAHKASAEDPWAYDALRLEAEVLTARAEAKAAQGDRDGGRHDLALAKDALDHGLTIARSDPGLYEDEGSRRLAWMEMEAVDGRYEAETLAWVLEGCDQALRVDPGSGVALERKAMAHARHAEFVSLHTGDPRPALAAARETAQEAARLHPGQPGPYLLEGFAWWQTAEYERGKGVDPHPSAAQGNRALLEAERLGPGDSVALSYAGVLDRSVAEYELTHGQDPRATLDRGQGYLERAVAANPNNFAALNNLAAVHFTRGRYEASHGVDPIPSFREAIARYQASLAINPTIAMVHNNLGAAYRGVADRLRQIGQDWEPDLERALTSFRKSSALNPTLRLPLYNLAFTLHTLADARMDKPGVDPSPLLAEARSAIMKSLAQSPEDVDNLMESAMVSLKEGRWASHQGRSGEPAFREAERALEHGLRQNSNYDVLYEGLANLWQARANVAKARERQLDLRKALLNLDRALAINPEALRALVDRGSILVQLAEGEARAIEQRRFGAAAVETFQKALRQEPTLKDEVREGLGKAKKLAGT